MTLSIKDHIDQGHYPTDDKGRALVPTDSGGVAVIGDTNVMDGNCMLGWMRGHSHDVNNCIGWWQDDGTPYTPVRRLLPPPPRKVTKYAAVHRDALQGAHWYESDGPARREVATAPKPAEFALLTMEYEEPWT